MKIRDQISPKPGDQAPEEDQILILTADHSSRMAPLRKPGVTIGSEPENDIVLDDPQVSKFHARIEYQDDQYRIIDLNSSNGTFLGDLRLRAGVPYGWEPDKALRIGENWLGLRKAGETGPDEILPNTILPKIDPNLIRWSPGKQVGVYTVSEQMSLTPGKSASVVMVVYNPGKFPGSYSLKVKGVPPDWVGSTPSTLAIPKESERQVSLVIHPPQSSITRIGRHGVTIQITSQTMPSEQVEFTVSLNVLPYARFQCRLIPGVEGEKVIHLKIDNAGNTPETFTITPRDPAGKLKIMLSRNQCMIDEGKSANVDVSVTTPLDLWSVRGRSYPFTLQVRASTGQVQTLDASALSRGLLPFWLVPIFVVLLLGLCVGSAWGLAGYLGKSSPTSTPTAFGTILPGGIGLTETLTAAPPTPTLAPPAATEVPPTGTALPATPTTQPPAPLPTYTPFPTYTPLPSATQPPPTDTPLPPTATPEPPSATPPPPTATTQPPTATLPPVTVSGQIAFASRRDGSLGIYLYRGDNQSVLRLTNNTGDDQHLDWARTGNRMAFDNNSTGSSEIYSMNADGSGLANLTNNPASDTDPAWSPDGAHLAFLTNRDGNVEIYGMNADGSGQTRLTNMPSDKCCVVWSPLGGMIAFMSNDNGTWNLYRMNPDGSSPMVLAQASSSLPAWSRDGARLAFTSNQDGNAEIYAVNNDGTGESRLTNNSAQDTSPAWSPNGSMIAFLSNRDGNFEIYAMNPDGSGQTRLTNTAGDECCLVWSPDGSQLAFGSNTAGNEEIYVLDIGTSGVLGLADNPAYDAPSAWRP